jgi:hypothetical protein
MPTDYMTHSRPRATNNLRAARILNIQVFSDITQGRMLSRLGTRSEIYYPCALPDNSKKKKSVIYGLDTRTSRTLEHKLRYFEKSGTAQPVTHCHFMDASSPVTGLEWPRGFQEVKVPRFHDNGTGRW